MKLKSEVVSILKNMSSINGSISINAHDDIFVVSPCSSVIAYAKLEDQFESDLHIYDMGQFLSVLGLFENPDISFNEGGKSVIISDGVQKVEYFLAEKEFIKQGKRLTIPEDSEVQFELHAEVIESVLKASKVMGLKYITINSDGDEIFIGACSLGDQTSNRYSESVGKGNGVKFDFYMNASKVNFLITDYVVTCSSRNISEFKSNDITYWVGFESVSSYGET